MKNKKIIWILSPILVVVLIGLFFVNKNGDYETIKVEKQDFIEKVEISGKVVPSQDINLSFEVVGKISRINVNTGDIVRQGDVIAELDASEISSELNEVYFNLEKEKALLSEVSGDLDSQNKLQNESQNLISTIKKSYITSDDVVKNIVDVFFDNPNQRFPEFTSALTNYFLREDINKKRREIGILLDEWKTKLDLLNESNISATDVQESVNNLKSLENLLSLISSEVDDYNQISSITQSQIDAYISNISSARNTIASLIVEMNAVYDSYRAVVADIPVLESSVNTAQATVQKLSARKDKYVLRAPFDGIITDKDIEPGQVVSAGETVLSMISNNSFEVESFIPELNILGVGVGDKATLDFDAFDNQVIFEATVASVDPRETLKDGITTYKVLLSFDEFDTEIRSGMTNNITIIKDKMSDQIVIPRYLVESGENGDYVEVLNSGEINNKYITLGRKDGSGGILVEDGLSVGDLLIKK